jgi:putative thioredoxin
LAEARLADRADVATTDVGVLLDTLLDRVKEDLDARQEFLDLLETLGPDDPRVLGYRKALASRLF